MKFLILHLGDEPICREKITSQCPGAASPKLIARKQQIDKITSLEACNNPISVSCRHFKAALFDKTAAYGTTSLRYLNIEPSANISDTLLF
jgi:hypothetical protein